MSFLERSDAEVKTPEQFEEQRLALKTIAAFLQVILYMVGIMALVVYMIRG